MDALDVEHPEWIRCWCLQRRAPYDHSRGTVGGHRGIVDMWPRCDRWATCPSGQAAVVSMAGDALSRVGACEDTVMRRGLARSAMGTVTVSTPFS